MCTCKMGWIEVQSHHIYRYLPLGSFPLPHWIPKGGPQVLSTSAKYLLVLPDNRCCKKQGFSFE